MVLFECEEMTVLRTHSLLRGKLDISGKKECEEIA